VFCAILLFLRRFLSGYVYGMTPDVSQMVFVSRHCESGMAWDGGSGSGWDGIWIWTCVGRNGGVGMDEVNAMGGWVALSDINNLLSSVHLRSCISFRSLVLGSYV
jgi:hypothetical protein